MAANGRKKRSSLMNLQTFRMIKKNELHVRENYSNKTPKCHVTSERERDRETEMLKSVSRSGEILPLIL